MKAHLKELDGKMNMLSAIESINDKIEELEGGDEDDDFAAEDIEIFVVEKPVAEEPAINAVFEQCKTQFRVSRDMPTCFEKSLIETNYYLSLFSQENQVDEALGLNT